MTSTKLPEHQTIWQHHNGNYYRVYDTTNEHTERPEEYPPTVSYRGENGKRWSKPLPNFLEKMTPTDLKVMPIRVGERVVFFERLPVRGVDVLGENHAEELCDIVSLLSYLLDLEIEPGMPGIAKFMEERMWDVFYTKQTHMIVPKILSDGYANGMRYGGRIQIHRVAGEYVKVNFDVAPPAGEFSPDFCLQVSRYYPDSKLAEVFAPVMRLNLPE